MWNYFVIDANEALYLEEKIAVVFIYYFLKNINLKQIDLTPYQNWSS